MVRIYGVDPGPEKSAIALITSEGGFEYSHTFPNESMILSIMAVANHPSVWAIEDIVFQGNKAGKSVIDTAKFIGRLQMIIKDDRRFELRRNVIVAMVTGGKYGGDAGVRRAIIEMFGGKSTAIGTQWNKGPLYEVRDHEWAALAAAIALRMKLQKGDK